MPRQARIDLPGYLYHVMVRGVNRCAIFQTDEDRMDFLHRLGQGILRMRSLCLTWALMSNHLHLLIVAGAPGLAALMHPLLTGYVGAFNRRYRRVGHLIQNRYQAILCQEDTYLRQLCRYIPLNPVRAGLVKNPAELAYYPWTGHAALLGKADHPWQAVDEVLKHFGAQVAPARQAYELFVREGWEEGHRKDLEGGGLIRSMGGPEKALAAAARGERQAFDDRILGDGDFVGRILREVDELEGLNRDLQHRGLTLQKIQTRAAARCGVDAEALLGRNRYRRVSEARALWVYAATGVLNVKSCVFVNLLGMSSGAISEIRKRGKRLSDRYQFLQSLKDA